MYHIGVDIGGTFTDMVVVDEAGEVRTYKTPSTPWDLSVGVFDAIELAAEDLGLSLEELLSLTAYLGHGTTAATNTFIERRGVTTGLITTRGFGDTILLQRTMGQWAGLGENVTRYSLRSLPPPLVPPHLIREVTERVDYKGEVVVPLNVEEARQAVVELVAAGIEAIAVCFLWSFKNPAHEREARRIITETAPHLFVTLSSDLVPVIREYERTATTVINCYLGPALSTYLTHLEDSLRRAGLKGSVTIMDSGGGVIPIEEASRKAVLLLTSGPAGGVLASVQMAETLGIDNVITTDMGGTSFDVSLIVDRMPLIAPSAEVGKYHIIVPMINITAIGAGGGSIARVEDSHLFVGPHSSGAEPGPACYGRGGEEPTVTDADVVLGIIDPDYFLGGRLKLSRERAEEAIRDRVARPLGMGVIEAAAGIRAIADNHMADLLRTLTIEKGYDPRDFVLFAYGGAGPTHCSTYGAELNVRCTVVPVTATVHSAYGAVASDLHCSFELSDLLRTPPFFDRAAKYLEVERINANFAALEKRCREALKRDDILFRRYLDMRYRRQVNEIIIPVPLGRLQEEDVDKLVALFEKKYEELYGQGAAFREAGVEITTFRVGAVAPLPKPRLKRYKVQVSDGSQALMGERRVFFNEERGFVPTRVYRGLDLIAGTILTGPAIIEYPGTTVVIGPLQRGRIDEYLNTIIGGVR